MLRRAHELLRPDGALYLTTPHARGISRRLLGLRWSTVAPPEHLQLFSLSGLKAVATRAGFTAFHLRTRGANPYELLDALRRRENGSRPPTKPIERLEGAYRLNASLLSSRAGVRTKGAVNRTPNALRLGDSLTCLAVRPESAGG